MNKELMAVNSLEKELIEIIRNEVPFGEITIETRDGVPLKIKEMRRDIDLRRRILEKRKSA